MCSCHGNSPYCSNENSWPFCFTAKNELNPMSWHIGCDGKSLWDGVLVSNHYTKYYHHHTGLKVEFLWCSLHFCHINIYRYNIYRYNIYLYIYIYIVIQVYFKTLYSWYRWNYHYYSYYYCYYWLCFKTPMIFIPCHPQYLVIFSGCWHKKKSTKLNLCLSPDNC